MHTHPIPRITWPVAVGLATLLVAGCGGGGGESTTTAGDVLSTVGGQPSTTQSPAGAEPTTPEAPPSGATGDPSPQLDADTAALLDTAATAGLGLVTTASAIAGTAPGEPALLLRDLLGLLPLVQLAEQVLDGIAIFSLPAAGDGQVHASFLDIPLYEWEYREEPYSGSAGALYTQGCMAGQARNGETKKEWWMEYDDDVSVTAAFQGRVFSRVVDPEHPDDPSYFLLRPSEHFEVSDVGCMELDMHTHSFPWGEWADTNAHLTIDDLRTSYDPSRPDRCLPEDEANPPDLSDPDNPPPLPSPCGPSDAWRINGPIKVRMMDAYTVDMELEDVRVEHDSVSAVRRPVDGKITADLGIAKVIARFEGEDKVELTFDMFNSLETRVVFLPDLFAVPTEFAFGP